MQEPPAGAGVERVVAAVHRVDVSRREVGPLVDRDGLPAGGVEGGREAVLARLRRQLQQRLRVEQRARGSMHGQGC